MSKFVDIWVDVSLSNVMRVFTVLVLMAYWTYSAYGVAQINVGLTSEKLLAYDSPLLPFVKIQRDIIFREGGQKFFFSTGFKNAVEWSDRLTVLQEWRTIAKQFSHFNVTIYEPFSMYSDQLLTIVPVTKSTVIFAFGCMAVVLMIFTPCLTTIITSTLSILSINLGVFGALSHWEIDLDPISMATTLMAIGFSVDFIAHITFHYYKGSISVSFLKIF
ncbi:unnamed protein product [Anisakis simplex]|uniref:SSD domain-containing protein n=1 Tax=Anisakis simplex TaxID=6269 RepID=A0A0M3K5T2_ANISI|nr:unnamed protein product [Anisakis simplex]